MRDIPAVHRFTTDPAIATYAPLIGRDAVRAHVHAVLEEARSGALTSASFEALRAGVLARLAAAQAEGLIGVINGTGVLLHTNFGRAPLSHAALESVRALGAGYTNLEFDLATGERGSRYDRVSSLLCELSGAQGALVVNNCAAAVLLVLDTFARGREVVVSRGELIEIGGGFRLPDVLAKSGATLVEVGTTNKTYLRDYRDAWNSNTALFMRTHPSNYRVTGFTAAVSAASLATLARELEVISFEDLGTGALVDVTPYGLPSEPTLAQEIAAGLDLVTVSGDKLLGGPQCGIIAGRAELIATLKRNPLLRALRVDKMTLAALGATLAAYAGGRVNDVPLFAMLGSTQDDLLDRARRLCEMVTARRPDARVTPVRTLAATGGGTLPDAEILSAGVAVHPVDSPDALAARLRKARPPVIGRVESGRLVIDLRTVRESELDALASSLGDALETPATP
ncbi:MAG: L-seryl-tRNA(Sec) selenium transferase [Candidatus Eremiobacteraeota bacterium]|nr:L-seryl-tRNA(Sec) selenium transferase [Candidatus Eremiobacteraeota bacterium]MBV8280625.1 L-seryl-tRNA(Sec) selenium transferase [Candidatus Eremiobacteraeota bacterium]